MVSSPSREAHLFWTYTSPGERRIAELVVSGFNCCVCDVCITKPDRNITTSLKSWCPQSTWKCSLSYSTNVSGQIIIFHQPRFPWNFRGPISLPNRYQDWGFENSCFRSGWDLTRWFGMFGWWISRFWWTWWWTMDLQGPKRYGWYLGHRTVPLCHTWCLQVSSPEVFLETLGPFWIKFLHLVYRAPTYYHMYIYPWHVRHVHLLFFLNIPIHIGVSKNMGKNPQNAWWKQWKTLSTWMICGAHPYFWKHPYSDCSEKVPAATSICSGSIQARTSASVSHRWHNS